MDMSFSSQERKKFQWFAIFSAWFGCVSEQLLISNSFIIIYLTTLGGNESFSMLSTTLGALCGTLVYLLLLLTGLLRSGSIEGGYALIKWAVLTVCGAVGGLIGVSRKKR